MLILDEIDFQKNVELLRLSSVLHTEHRVRTMQQQMIKRLGKELQAKMPVRENMPPSIQQALERLAAAESHRDGSAPELRSEQARETTCR